jgi:hypothetical protein
MSVPNDSHQARITAAICLSNVVLPGCIDAVGLVAAIEIIKALAGAGYVITHKSMLGAISDLPAEDEARLDKAYAGAVGRLRGES